MNLNVAILRCAAMLVPPSRRADWLYEWQSELWYIRRKRAKAIPFCLGAFRDAAWMRRNCADTDARQTPKFHSPLQCLSILVLSAAVTIFFAFRVPLPRDLILAFPYPDPQRLTLVSAAGQYGSPRPNVSFAQYRALERSMRRQFSELAFYRPVLSNVSISKQRTEEISVVRATPNLFALLGIPAPHGTNSLILSESAARRYFGGTSKIIGRKVAIGGKHVEVAGVLSDRLWRLPGAADAWLLEEDRNLSVHMHENTGFVVARLWAVDYPNWHWRWQVSVPDADGDFDTFTCASLIPKESLVACISMLAVALLLLPVTTTLTLGEYPASTDRTNKHAWIRRWLFLGTKLALLLPIVCFGVLELAPLPILPIVLLVGYVVALHWAMNDQRRRCPICLRRLTGPVRVGCPSHVFLAWYGTELACPKGHGLMHVPEIPTSCYSTQRWLNLDPSWRSLFS